MSHYKWRRQMSHYKWAKQMSHTTSERDKCYTTSERNSLSNIGSWNVSVIKRISFACFCDFISLTLQSPRIDLKTALCPNELLLMVIAEPRFSAILHMTIDI